MEPIRWIDVAIAAMITYLAGLHIGAVLFILFGGFFRAKPKSPVSSSNPNPDLSSRPDSPPPGSDLF